MNAPGGNGAAPRVTVLLPTYNAAEFIADTLRSVLAQSFTDYEIVLLDNASTDATAAVVAQFDDPRLKVHRNPVNIGFAANVQLGRTLAGAPYVVVFNADDLWAPDYLSRTVAVLDANPKLSVVHARIILMDETGCSYGEAVTDWPEVTPGRAAVPRCFIAGFSSPTMLMRNSVLQSVPPIPLGEPWEKVPDCWLLLQLCLRGDVGYVAAPLMRYRVHSASLMSEIYLDGSFFMRRLATVRDAFDWPALRDSQGEADFRRVARAVAVQSAMVLPTLRARQPRWRVVLAFAQIAARVPSVLLNAAAWARLGYGLLPRAVIVHLRVRRRTGWARRHGAVGTSALGASHRGGSLQQVLTGAAGTREP